MCESVSGASAHEKVDESDNKVSQAIRGTDSIPSITFKDLVKYLGVEIQPDRTVKLPRALWKRYLKNLSIAHLNPIQKVEGIRQVIVAKIQHQLKLSDHRFEETKKIN